jgi:hypothetical protein
VFQTSRQGKQPKYDAYTVINLFYDAESSELAQPLQELE